MIMKRPVICSYIIIYVLNHTLLVAGAGNTSMSSQHNTYVPEHDTDNATLFNSDNVSVPDTDYKYTVVHANNIFGDAPINISWHVPSNIAPNVNAAILIAGIGSMRLRTSDTDGINSAILEWHAYCSQYVHSVWQEAGYNKSQMVLSFNWAKIDDTRLDVFFIGVSTLNSQNKKSICLSSNETLQNTTGQDDVCSRLTLGGFGENLISSNNAKFVIRTNINISALHAISTNNYIINSVEVNRLIMNASYMEEQDAISIQSDGSRKNIFGPTIQDFSVYLSSSECAPGRGAPKHGSFCMGCEFGKYKPDYGSHICTDCASGHYSQIKSLFCQACPSHAVQTAVYSRAPECIYDWLGRLVGCPYEIACSCNAGYGQTNLISACQLCGPGTFAPGGGSTWPISIHECLQCEHGKYQPDSGQTSCLECGAGNYFTVSNNCILCPDNTEMVRGSTKCTCLPNTYEMPNRILSQPCSSCPDGQVTQDGKGGIGPASCQCTAGSYRLTAEDENCKECPIGRTSPPGMIGNMQDVCSCSKSKGYYSTMFGCLLCEGGHELNENIPEDCQSMDCVCLPCGKGKYRAAGYEGYCVDCEDGKFSSSVGSLKCNDCTGTVSQNYDECVLPAVLDPPKIMHHSTVVVFDHFEDNTLVKTILGSVHPPDWKSGDTVRIYENGTRNLNPVVFVYNDAKWSPININPIHNRDNVYVFNTPRSENYTPHYMSILWQNTPNVELLSTYEQRINMQPHFLRKQFGVLSSDDILVQNEANSHYTPFEVRIINNEPIYTTQIIYS